MFRSVAESTSLAALTTALCVETTFFLVYRYSLVPRANKRLPARRYRDYPSHDDRRKLFERILGRIERTAIASKKDVRGVIQDFLYQWFHNTGTVSIGGASSAVTAHVNQGRISALPLLKSLSASGSLSTTPSVTPETSDDEEDEDQDAVGLDAQTADLRKGDIDSLFAWAFFGKETFELDEFESAEVDLMTKTLQDKHKLEFESGSTGVFQPRRFTFDSVNPLHRPFSLYLFIGALEKLGGVFLRAVGFRKHQTNSGLSYWHRAGQAKEPNKRMPLLFFHGIAPAGLLVYLPIVLFGLGDTDRTMLLFENKPISCSIGFDALTEDETVEGVEEALRTHVDRDSAVAVAGHSFGSCPMTWLLHSSLRPRIRQFTLLDPVSILLSEPDVMINFLYSRHQGDSSATDARSKKIQLVAASELFTEYYLRRQFSWYNSELWLDDISDDCQVLVCISENDEIISAPKVKKEVEIAGTRRPNMKLIHWEGVRHGDCISCRTKWNEIRKEMFVQEQLVLMNNKKRQ